MKSSPDTPSTLNVSELATELLTCNSAVGPVRPIPTPFELTRILSRPLVPITTLLSISGTVEYPVISMYVFPLNGNEPPPADILRNPSS